ncbi:uncharacterized protein [Parasteatoda tepidariorum]|uniref:uncharacterized protein n=1 Tax=Parasteatoda tepidariorum TaxID=114398 RepID=UPI0039BD4B14
MFVSKFITMAKDYVMQDDMANMIKPEENKAESKTDTSKNLKFNENRSNNPAGEGASKPSLSSIRFETNVINTSDGTSINLLGNNLNPPELTFKKKSILNDNETEKTQYLDDKYLHSRCLISDADFICNSGTNESDLRSNKDNDLRLASATELFRSSTENFVSLPNLLSSSYSKSDSTGTYCKSISEFHSTPGVTEIDNVVSSYNSPLVPLTSEADSNNEFNIIPSVECEQEMVIKTPEDNVSDEIFSSTPIEDHRDYFSTEKARISTISEQPPNKYKNLNLKDMAYSVHENIPKETLIRKPAEDEQLKTPEKHEKKKIIFTQTETVPQTSIEHFDNNNSSIFIPKEISDHESKKVYDFVYKTFPTESPCRKFVEDTKLKAGENHRNKKSIFTQTDTMPQTESRRHNNNHIPISSSINNTFHTLETFVSKKASLFLENSYRKHMITEDMIYGELLVFGCNGSPPSHLVGKMQSKFILRKRLKSNGVKESFTYVTTKNTSRRRDNLTVSYSIPNGSSVVVEYIADKSTDMFQVGRSDDPPVDFKVLDVNTESRKGVSRFACRLVVQRNGSHEARVHAAAFDSSGDIFLGKDAFTVSREGKVDGFTTNGVYIMHPDSDQPIWREVSVCGNIYPLRSKQIASSKRPRILSENNILSDGTLIDLCGVTLLWRTPSGLRNTPTGQCLQKLQSLLQTMTPDCHLPSLEMIYSTPMKYPFVFLCCGHVMRLSAQFDDSLKGWSCPICRSIGPIARLEIGIESGFYFDQAFPSHCFRPCGHVTNLKTVQFWSRVKVPEHRNIEAGFCPFCGVKLNSINKYIQLLVPQ